ncbi:hypothetical protein AVEN_179819-1 [Araneus ventricosus]|uniref:Uncharacterized protein n=1 Tax=Araneus ventricosus TaxID=182803 RepID=A0A4Y2F9Q7_ARAVE|nr:hypothetical protein AVEN_179819-1 [Araneus ventricosus]
MIVQTRPKGPKGYDTSTCYKSKGRRTDRVSEVSRFVFLKPPKRVRTSGVRGYKFSGAFRSRAGHFSNGLPRKVIDLLDCDPQSALQK